MKCTRPSDRYMLIFLSRPLYEEVFEEGNWDHWVKKEGQYWMPKNKKGKRTITIPSTNIKPSNTITKWVNVCKANSIGLIRCSMQAVLS